MVSQIERLIDSKLHVSQRKKFKISGENYLRLKKELLSVLCFKTHILSQEFIIINSIFINVVRWAKYEVTLDRSEVKCIVLRVQKCDFLEPYFIVRLENLV